MQYFYHNIFITIFLSQYFIAIFLSHFFIAIFLSWYFYCDIFIAIFLSQYFIAKILIVIFLSQYFYCNIFIAKFLSPYFYHYIFIPSWWLQEGVENEWIRYINWNMFVVLCCILGTCTFLFNNQLCGIKKYLRWGSWLLFWAPSKPIYTSPYQNVGVRSNNTTYSLPNIKF